MASAVGVWCEEVEEEGAPAVRACRRSRFVAQYRAYPLQSGFSVRVRGLFQEGTLVYHCIWGGLQVAWRCEDSTRVRRRTVYVDTVTI